ncbi:MAG: hypothetical protein KDE27_26110 [Planctomycetes bacterium]|nr:hypothetical protein [Planctomycetota bacterium]
MTLLLAALLNLAALPQSPAADVAGGAVPANWNEPFVGLYVDPAPDPEGRTWCRGTRYKMSFGPDGAAFVPLLGFRAARSHPMAFHLVGAPLTAPERDGERFVFRHPGVEERWQLAPDGAEQSFWLTEPPPAGELAIELSTDLRYLGRFDDGLRFGGEGDGKVVYGDAIAIEPNGARWPLSTTFAGGRVHIALPPGASYPLLVDPPVTVVDVALNEVGDNRRPAVAFHRGSGRWAVVMEERLSVSDTDIKVRRFDTAGTAVETDFFEISTEAAEVPDIACSQAGGVFKAVWTQAGKIVTRGVLAGAILPLPAVIAFNPTGSEVGLAPAIGGSDTHDFLVVFTREGNLITPRLRTVLVPDLAGLGAIQEITNNLGCLTGAVSERRQPLNDWIVAYCRQSLGCSFTGDIGYAAVNSNGFIEQVETTVAGGAFDDDRRVSVASNGVHGLIVWDRDVGSHHDLVGRLVEKTGAGYATVGPERNLSAAEPGVALGDDQYAAKVASDGVRFVYVYEEGNAEDIVAASLGVVGSGVLYHEGHQVLIANGRSHLGIGLAGGAPAVAADVRWLVAADERLGINDHDIRGMFYDALVPGGLFATVATGCQPIGGTEPQIQVAGSAAVGESFTVSTSGTTQLPFLIAGLPKTPSTVFCQYLVVRTCRQGVELPAMAVVFGGSLTILVPTDPGLVGLELGFQGVDLLATGACSAALFGAAFAVTDTIVATVR